MIVLQLFLDFALLSFVAFGGATALLPEMHRVVVEQHHWLNDATFTHLYAIAQAAPGPNVLVVTLIGWEVAGLAGGADEHRGAGGCGFGAQRPAAAQPVRAREETADHVRTVRGGIFRSGRMPSAPLPRLLA